MIISFKSLRQCGILAILLTSLLTQQNQSVAQQAYGSTSRGASGSATKHAPGQLQPAYMPSATASVTQVHETQSLGSVVEYDSVGAQEWIEGDVQQDHYLHSQTYAPTSQHPSANYHADPELGPSSRVPRRSDLMATDQHRLLQYRRMYRNGTTPHPAELNGQWNGVNKGIVEIAGYSQFIKDIQVDGCGRGYGDNVQVKQVKAGQVRLNGWQPKYDLRAKDFERRGSFAVQQANGRGFFGHGHTFSYADGNNPAKDPARLLEDQVVKIDDNHMLGRAVAKFGPFKIPLSYFVLERRQDK